VVWTGKRQQQQKPCPCPQTLVPHWRPLSCSLWCQWQSLESPSSLSADLWWVRWQCGAGGGHQKGAYGCDVQHHGCPGKPALGFCETVLLFRWLLWPNKNTTKHQCKNTQRWSWKKLNEFKKSVCHNAGGQDPLCIITVTHKQFVHSEHAETANSIKIHIYSINVPVTTPVNDQLHFNMIIQL